MIPENLIYSVPESGSSLDNVIRRTATLEAKIQDDDGDPSLRFARDTDTEILKTAEEAEGPVYDIKKKIQEWRAHARDHATGAGFRKANRGSLDPRQFALQLSQRAQSQARQYQSPYLARLARRLRWVARQKTTAAARLLERLADMDDGSSGPRVEKPRDQPVPVAERTDSERNSWSPLQPGLISPESFNPAQYHEIQPDHSWESERAGSRKAAGDDEIDFNDDNPPSVDGSLIQNARDFLNHYRSTNSFTEDEFLSDRLTQPEVFESWLVDLDNQGIQADPSELDSAWNQAIYDMTDRDDRDFDTGQNRDKTDGLSTASRKKLDFSEDPQKFVAPGGDWANTIIRPEENPQLDRYLSRQGHRFAASRYSVTQVVDQLLDHVAGEMVPGEISPEHVQQFVESEYPDTSWKKVYAVIQKIADPNRRHEHERTTEDRDSSRRASESPEMKIFLKWQQMPGMVRTSPGSYRNRESYCAPLTHEEAEYLAHLFKISSDKSVYMSGEFRLRNFTQKFGLSLPDRFLLALREGKAMSYLRYVGGDSEKLPRELDLQPLIDQNAGEQSEQEWRPSESLPEDFYTASRQSFRREADYMHTPFDVTLQSSSYRRLQGQREICACCHGTGEGDTGTCTGCAGKGRELINPDDPDLKRKGRLLEKTGSLLLVAVDRNAPGVSSRSKRALSCFTGNRRVSSGIECYRHSPELMQLLQDYDIPYRTANYRHPQYGRRGVRRRSPKVGSGTRMAESGNAAHGHSWVISYKWKMTHDDKDKRVWSTPLNEEEAEVIGVITNSPLKTKNGRGTQQINPSHQTKIGLVGPLEAYLTYDDENNYQLQVHTNNKSLRLPKSVSVGPLLNNLKQKSKGSIPCRWEYHGMTAGGLYYKQTSLKEKDAELLMTVFQLDRVSMRNRSSVDATSIGKFLGLPDQPTREVYYEIELVNADGSYYLDVLVNNPYVKLSRRIDL
jgi:hypothetical protein